MRGDMNKAIAKFFIVAVCVQALLANTGIMFGKSEVKIDGVIQQDLEINGVKFHNSSLKKDSLICTLESIKIRKNGTIYSTPVILVWPVMNKNFKGVLLNQSELKEDSQKEAFKLFFSYDNVEAKETDMSIDIAGELSNSVFPIVKRVVSSSLFGKGSGEKSIYAIFIAEKNI